MYNESKDYDNDGLDVAEAAARPPNWFSYSSYSMQQDQLQDPSYQYPEAGNTGEWYSAPSTSAHTSATSTATGHLDHYTATSSQTALRRAHANPLYYSELGTDGQNPAFAGTAAESAYPTTPLQPEGYYEADSNLTFTGNSASPSTSAPTSFAAYDGYVSSQRPVGSGNTRSGARTLSSRRTRPSSQQSYHPHQDQYSHPASQHLQVPRYLPLDPTSPTLPCSTTIPSPTPSSTSHGTFMPQECKWEDCSSSTIFQREVDLVRHLKTIHISPNAFPCPEPDCTKAFGRNDHLKNHLKTMHRF